MGATVAYEDNIRSSELFQRFSSEGGALEIWPDPDFSEGGFAYFWIVSKSPEAVRNLAYVRCVPGEMQHRTYDKDGDDLWIPLK
jgi:hypothetical protein